MCVQSVLHYTTSGIIFGKPCSGRTYNIFCITANLPISLSLAARPASSSPQQVTPLQSPSDPAVREKTKAELIIGLHQFCCGYWNEQKHLELGGVMDKTKQIWRITKNTELFCSALVMRLTVKLTERCERQVSLEDKYLMIFLYIFLYILLSLPLRLAWKSATVNEICRI